MNEHQLLVINLKQLQALHAVADAARLVLSLADAYFDDDGAHFERYKLAAALDALDTLDLKS